MLRIALTVALLLSGCGTTMSAGSLPTQDQLIQGQQRGEALVITKMERARTAIGTFRLTLECRYGKKDVVLELENVDEQHGTRWHWVKVNGKYLTNSNEDRAWLTAFADSFDAATRDTKQGLAVQVRYYLRKTPTVWEK